MKVGIIGSGGREHALANLLKNQLVDTIFCFQEMLERKKLQKNSNRFKNFKILKDFILDNRIDLIIVGPEKPLVDGIVDYLEKFKIKVLAQTKLPLN